MKKPYCGNEKPYILALFCEEDRNRVMPILEKIEKTGLELYGFDGKIRRHKASKACAFAAFIGAGFASDPERMAMLSFAKQKGIPVIAVKLENGIPDGGELQEHLAGASVIGAEELTEEELCARIMQTDVLDPPAVTEKQRKCKRIRLAMLSCMILAAIIAGVVSFGIRTQGWFSPTAKRLMVSGWMRGDLTILEQLLH